MDSVGLPGYLSFDSGASFAISGPPVPVSGYLFGFWTAPLGILRNPVTR